MSTLRHTSLGLLSLSLLCATIAQAQAVSATLTTFPETSVGSASETQDIQITIHSFLKVNSISVPYTDSAGDGCPATSVHLAVLDYVKVDPAGNFYFNDAARVRKVDISTGIISTVAGTGTYGFSGDGGPATEAELNAPQGLAFDANNNLYIADAGNYRIRKVSADTGIITTYAGTSSETGILPAGLASDAAGNLYIADVFLNHVIEKVSAATGALTVVAGNAAKAIAVTVVPQPAPK
jgi:hypothetical protein